MTLRYDAQGKLISQPETEPTAVEQTPVAAQAARSLTQAAQTSEARLEPEVVPQPQTPSTPLIPLWFVAAVSLLNLALAGIVWWLFKPTPLNLAAAA